MEPAVRGSSAKGKQDPLNPPQATVIPRGPPGGIMADAAARLEWELLFTSLSLPQQPGGERAPRPVGCSDLGPHSSDQASPTDGHGGSDAALAAGDVIALVAAGRYVDALRHPAASALLAAAPGKGTDLVSALASGGPGGSDGSSSPANADAPPAGRGRAVDPAVAEAAAAYFDGVRAAAAAVLLGEGGAPGGAAAAPAVGPASNESPSGARDLPPPAGAGDAAGARRCRALLVLSLGVASLNVFTQVGYIGGLYVPAKVRVASLGAHPNS